ncbi:MAG TPA: hypothetical protein PKY50_03810 [Candidatus Competibacter sp.]|nr:hypothetical protein [Candidatus Competibacter sp.]
MKFTLAAAPAAGQKLKSWVGCTTANSNVCAVSSHFPSRWTN